MLGVGGILAEAVADVVVPPGADHRGRRRGDDRRPRAPRRCSAPFRGEPAVDRERAGRRAASGCRPLADGATRRRQRRPQPADRRRRACRSPSTRWSSSARVDAARRDASDRRAVPRPVRAHAAWSSPARRRHPGKFGFVALHNILAARLRRAGSSPPTCEGEEVLGIADRRRRRRPARRRGRPRLRVHAGRGQPRPAAGRARPRASGPRSSPSAGYGEAGEDGQRAAGRAGRAGRRARHPARRPERPGRGVARRRSCAPRSSRPYPPAGRIGVASQSGNFVSSAS